MIFLEGSYLLEKKKTIILIIFITSCLSLTSYFLFSDWKGSFSFDKRNNSNQKRENSQSYFNGIKYYYLQAGKPKIFLDGDRLIMNDLGESGKVQKVRGVAFSNNQTSVNYSAKEGFWDELKENIELKGEVQMNTKTSEIFADNAKYFLKKNYLRYLSNVKTITKVKKTGDTIYIDANKAESWFDKNISKYIGSVRGKVVRKKVYETNVNFASDKLNINRNNNIIELLGNVSIKKHEFNAKALKGEIHLETYNKRFKYYALFDDVRVLQKIKHNGKMLTRKAFAEKLEGFMLENKIVLTGAPKVFQDTDVIKGNRITLREGSEIVEVDDAVTNFILK